MAVHIRLQRKGAVNRPFYHLVASDHRANRDGNFIEKLGYYDPNPELSKIKIDADRVQHWYGLGAQLSTAVKALVKIQKISLSRNKA